MTTTSARSGEDRHEIRRRALGESALRTLGEVGYARTSLREIASHSEFSHGVVHYYFRDKTELIVYGVRQYKAQCVTRYDDVVADSTTSDGLVESFAAKLVETIVDEAPMHRLWYDLRTQSMFEPSLREDVLAIDRALEGMVWRVIEKYAALSDKEPALSPPVAYAMLDGLFQQALLGHLCGREGALEALVEQVHGLLPMLLRS